MQRIIFLLSTLPIVAIFYAHPVEAGRCTRVIQNESAEYIVNTCNTCRKVNIRRKRRGVAMPVMRTYNIQPSSKFPTSFKGIGRSRISSEVPCEGAHGAGVNIINSKTPAKQLKKCVTLRVIGSGRAALINNCSSCRGVAVQRYAQSGRSLGRQVYKMGPLSVISVKPKGAAQLRYLTDVSCAS